MKINMPSNISYEEFEIIFNRIAKAYTHFKMTYKKELYNKFSVDCGTDYARFILNEFVYDENGESIV